MEIKPNDIVTVQFKNSDASNTFIVEDIIYNENSEPVEASLTHPLFPEISIKKRVDELNLVQANIKDSSERSLDFANNNSEYLDYNSKSDLEALCIYFVIRRKLTPRQKYILANILGRVASAKFNDNIKSAMDFIKKNEALLDEFNSMWYRNFRHLFTGRKSITSGKQKSAIFNMAGFLLAETKTPISIK